MNRKLFSTILILFISLTTVLLAFPVHKVLVYYTVSSSSIFDNLFLFSLIFTVWAALAFILLRIKKEAYFQIIVLCLFSLVFLGFWTIITPYGDSPDAMWLMGHAQSITDMGKIDFQNLNFGYAEFPALPLLSSIFSQLTGLDIFLTRTIYLLSSVLIFTFTLFVLYRKVFENNFVASIATIMLIMGNIWISIEQAFHPANLSFLYFNGILILLFTNNLSKQRQLLFVTLYGALVAAYVSLSFGFLFVLLALPLSLMLRKTLSAPKLQTNSYLYLLFISLTLFFGWEIYQAIRMFPNLTQWATSLFSSSLQEKFFVISNVGAANLGGSVPLWANATRLFWWIFIFGYGLIISLRFLKGFSKRNWIIRNLLVWLGSFLVFGFLVAVVSPGGSQAHRIMLYAPFFIIPLILIPLVKKKTVLYSIIGLLVILSVPTFLAYNPRITYISTYQTELSGAAFIEKNCISDANLNVVAPGWSRSSCYVFLYNAHFSTETDNSFVSVKNYWHSLNTLKVLFEQKKVTETSTVFLFSPKSYIVPEHLLGISPNDPQWLNFTEILDSNNLIYFNGDVQLFS